MEQPLRQVYEQSGITEQEVTIEGVHLYRSTGLVEVSCSIYAPLEEGRRLAFEQALREALSRYTLQFSYAMQERAPEPEMLAPPPPPVAPTTVVVKKKTNQVEADLPENNILLGNSIPSGKRTPIHELCEEERQFVIEGSLVSATLREGWGNKKENMRNSWRVQLNITDYTDSVYAEATFHEEWKAQRFLYWVETAKKKGKNLVLRGNCKTRKFNAELNFFINDCNLNDRILRQDTAPEKRVELHLHTRMSTMDGVTDLTSAFKTAARWGHKAMAITDHGCVQAFPEAAKAAKATGVKAIYGVEGYLLPDTVDFPMEGEYVAFDIETTGLKAESCDIIEIGAVRLVNGVVTERFDTFIDDGVVVPKKITELTGITRDMLRGAPTSRDALQQFRNFCGNACLVAHNARFDIGFITHHGEKFGIRFDLPYADTLTLSRYILHDDVPNHKLDTLCHYYDIDMGSHHRADDDANSCALLLLKLMEELKTMGVSILPVVPDAALERERHLKKEKQKTYHIIILAQNQAGMKNLYKLVSFSNLDHLRGGKPQIPRSMLSVFRGGLILGSACEAGELYRAVLQKRPEEELRRIAGYYDYLEIQPDGNNAFLVREGMVPDEEGLHAINRKILSLGDELGKMTVATGDVHFLEPEDAIYRQILLYKLGFDDAEFQAPLYFKSTDQMLDEFSYLGERAKEVVVDNPNAIAEKIEVLKPFPDGTHAPMIPNAEELLTSMTMDKAHSIYGDPLPEVVQKRLDKELSSIIGNHFASLYLMAQRLVHKSNSDGYLVGSRGSVGSSFVATMSGITEVNPLSPHYVCPNCKFSDFDIDPLQYNTGVDLPDRDCPQCGTRLKKEGFDIPFEVFLGFHGDKTPDIDLNFSGEYQHRAHKYVEEMFGEHHAYRAGTIAGIAEKKGFECVYHYQEATGKTLRRAEIERLSQGCLNVKVTTGQHPAGIVIVPKDEDIYMFTPIQYPADKVEQGIITTHFDFHAMDDRLVKLDILGHDDPTALRMLQDLTGIDPTTIPLDDPETRKIYSSPEPLNVDLSGLECTVGTLGVPEFGTSFVQKVLEQTRPTTMEELVRISGLTHGTDVWLNNAEPLVVNGIAKLKEVLCTRDDIMNYLIVHGMEASLSFKIMERVRKGKGLTDEMEEAMRQGKIPDWFIGSCKKIKYMFPRGHAVAYTMMGFRIAYFKVHHPLEFYTVYYTVRADAFDISRSLGGAEEVLRQIHALEKSLDAADADASKKDKDLITILEVVYEMNMRGIELLPVDIYKSQGTKFVIENGAIRPPFTAIAGIGTNAAIAMAENRGTEPFRSVEDFAARTGANSGVISALESCGCFADLPKSNQLSLFDF
ncbi:MAG: PolC-type DNA polymerase III [Clostridia bacterium]|nr:PolC-type DNA polymerase III [Clostridia bacterium]